MDENTLASYLYDYGMASCADIGDIDPEERNIWTGFLASLEQACIETGCDANTAVLLQSNQEDKVCGFHREYGYYYVSCGDRGERYLVILEQNRDEALNLFLERVFDKMAYEYALLRQKDEEKAWSYHCRFDYRKIWFGQALAWLAPVVDWQFFVECAGRYVELLNRWFAVPHWEYDFELGCLIETGYSREYTDSKYLRRVVYEEFENASWVILEPQSAFLEEEKNKCRPEGYAFRVDGKVLDMDRYEDRVCILLEGEEDNLHVYTLEGELLWKAGKRLDNWTYPDIQPFLLEYLMENEKK